MTPRQITLVIVGLMAAMFLSSLNQTVVGTSMRTIADDLHGLDQQAWVTTAFLITSTVMTPIYGKLSDLFGRRPLFIIAIVIFLAGSVLATFSNTMIELAAWRALQGVGAGGLMALPLTVMGDILAPRERAKYQGYFLAVFGISSVIGPLVGGLLAGADEILFITGWRWVFLINLPIGVGALIMVMAFLHIPHHAPGRVRIDWWGVATIMLAVVPLLLVAEQGREWGWGSAGAILCYVLGAIGIVSFILVERRMGADALIPLGLFGSPTFSMATILSVLVGFGMFGAMMTLPLYLQLVDGATPTEAGWMMLPMIGGLMISSIASGQIIARTGRYKVFPILGTGLLSGAFLLLTFSSYDKPLWFTMIGMGIAGLGLGQLMQTLTIASQNAVGAKDMGVATSAATFFRQMGGTLGVAIVFSVLFSRVAETISESFQKPELLRAALDAALDPAVAQAPENAAIMEGVYGPITQQVAANLPAGVDLADDQVRAGVVDQIVQQAGAGGFGGGSGAGGSFATDSSFLNGASDALTAPFRDGFATATVTVFWVSALVVLVAFLLSFFLKATPLRQKSAVAEAAEARAAAAELEVEARRAADLVGAPVAPNTDSIPTVGAGPR
ncbi:MDR family MFS transporter [Homoserinibacter sp. YIM 151385]|uniref:MDR family MFS transporter n=1 Tax=Homoserinibacter sp. YIM 151385 TaxID=2985506 RepID=UPI0022F01A34|nr:MDR family MFS transporter [Homoserinibacter sp. YIM 151385]WBU39388.1 MDR family MFS transporter [Homoserinibacter sp. YIM 151385]